MDKSLARLIRSKNTKLPILGMRGNITKDSTDY